MRKLTPKEREQLQAKLDEQSVEQAKKEQELRKHEKNVRTPKSVSNSPRPVLQLLPFFGPTEAATHHDISQPAPGGKGQELEEQKRKKRTGRGPGLRQMKLTEEEKRQLEARIRGIK